MASQLTTPCDLATANPCRDTAKWCGRHRRPHPLWRPGPASGPAGAPWPRWPPPCSVIVRRAGLRAPPPPPRPPRAQRSSAAGTCSKGRALRPGHHPAHAVPGRWWGRHGPTPRRHLGGRRGRGAAAAAGRPRTWTARRCGGVVAAVLAGSTTPVLLLPPLLPHRGAAAWRATRPTAGQPPATHPRPPTCWRSTSRATQGSRRWVQCCANACGQVGPR